MRRAQLQALEPILITMVLVIIAGIGLLFYLKISGGEQRGELTLQSEKEALTLLSTISMMPELSCTNNIAATNCIDRYKAQHFAQAMRDERTRSQYYSLLGAANITIEMLDLEGGTPATIQLYANTESRTLKPVKTYFTVYDPVSGTKNFAVLTIWRER